MGKKERERKFLRIVLEHLGISADDIPEGEAPDFVLSGDQDGVGVEVTELRRPLGDLKDAYWEGACAGVVDLAEKEWKEAGKDCVGVNVTFDGSVTHSRKERPEIAASLVSIVDEIRPAAGGQAVAGKGPAHLVRQSDCPPGVYAVLVNACEGDRTFWFAAAGGAVRHLGPDVIQTVLDAKDRKVARYRRRAKSEVWLIIGHSLQAHFSSQFYDDGALDGVPFTTSFDRLFVVNDMRGEVREIELATT